MSRSTDITNFSEHRRQLREHFDQCRRTGRPLYVTTNGEADAVVLSPEAYDQLAEQAELAHRLARLDRSMEEVRDGRTKSARAAVHEVAGELGLELDQ